MNTYFAMLGAILLGGVGLLWLIFAASDDGSKGRHAKAPTGAPGAVTNIGMMPPGQQVNPLDQWVGTAGSKLAQYENEREERGGPTGIARVSRRARCSASLSWSSG